MLFVNILLFIVVLIVLLYLYRNNIKYTPKIYVNEEKPVSKYVNEISSLKKPYRPTWWLLNRHLHTIRGMRFRKSSKMTNHVRRDELIYSDKGTSMLDWFETEEMTKDTPILFIIHTCAGGTREPCSNNLAEAAVKKGWRTVIFNNRCCSGAPITSSRMIAILMIDDLEAAIEHIRKQFTPKYLFMAGFSLGAYQALQYAMNGEGIDAAACISHTYDPVKAELILHKPLESRLYQSVIMQKLTHFAKKNKFLNNPAAENAKTMLEYDEAIWCHGLTEFTNGTDMYQALNVYDKIPRIKVPTLFLGSLDDPFTSSDFIPVKEAKASENVAIVIYPEGGHVSFLTGKEGNVSLIDSIIPEWFETVMKHLDK